MKELIMEKLSKIPNLEERKLLKDIINGVFVSIVDYNEEMFKKLTREIFEEIQYDENRYTIYTSLASREEVDPIHEFLYPMISEDMKELEYEEKEIAADLEAGKETRLMKVFLECDYLLIKEILGEKQLFDGIMITDKGKHEIKVKLRQNTEYARCIEELYGYFIRNGIVWTTVNSPYMNKFADVYLCGMDKPLEKGEKIKEVTINLRKYDKYKKENMVPLWNIQKLELPSLTFPVPALDHINYQHEISLTKSGEEHGYLVILGEDFNGYVKRNKDTITVSAPIADIIDWKVFKVAAYAQSDITADLYEIMSNKIKNSFMNRYARQQPRVIRTKAELYRIISSFDLSQEIEFLDFRIIEKGHSRKETYSMDFFLTDGIREENYKKILLLEFGTEQESFITRDIISFIVSEIQQYFPEYVCQGKLRTINKEQMQV